MRGTAIVYVDRGWCSHSVSKNSKKIIPDKNSIQYKARKRASVVTFSYSTLYNSHKIMRIELITVFAIIITLEINIWTVVKHWKKSKMSNALMKSRKVQKQA